MNPVRAGMVDHPGEYRWSSYVANATGEFHSIVSPHTLYLQLGGDDSGRQFAYRELFHKSLDTTLLHQLRETLNQELVLGREDFKNKIAQITQRQVRRGKDGRPKLEDIQEGFKLSAPGILEKTGI